MGRGCSTPGMKTAPTMNKQRVPTTASTFTSWELIKTPIQWCTSLPTQNGSQTPMSSTAGILSSSTSTRAPTDRGVSSYTHFRTHCRPTPARCFRSTRTCCRPILNTDNGTSLRSLVCSTSLASKTLPTGRIDRYTLKTRKLETIVEPRKHTLTSVSRAGPYIFAEYIEDLKSFAVVFDLDGKQVDEIRMPFPSNLWGLRGRAWHREAFFGAEGYAQPSQVHRYDFATKSSEKVWQVELDFESEQYVSEQVFYSSKDGTKVPMFLIHRRDLKRDGSAPTYLMGYGCYGYVLARSLLRRCESRGWKKEGSWQCRIFCGGGAYGQRWHRAGKKQNKQNSIDDFIAAAEWLHRRGLYVTQAHRDRGGVLWGAARGSGADPAPRVVCRGNARGRSARSVALPFV